MHLIEKNLKLITQVLLLAVIAIVPFIKIDTLYFPFVSGKAYVFRALVAIAFFFWIWLLLKEKRDKSKETNFLPIFKNILVVAIVLFFLAQVAAAFFGVDTVYSLFSSIERADGVLQCGFWVLYFLMFLSVFREKRDWKLFFAVFTLVALALSGYSWFNHEAQTQLYGVFGNPAYFAAFLIFAIGFSLVAFERKLFYPGPVHYAFGAAAGFFVLTLIFTQVRGVYVGLAGGVLLFSLLAILFLRKENKKLVFLSGVILLMGLSALGVLFVAKDTEYVQSTRLLYRIAEVTEIWEQGSTRERLLNWNIALKAFKERPLFGYGPENYASAANTYYDYRIGVGEPWFDRAHNQPLDTLATGGIVVFSAYLFWLAAAAFLILKIAKRERLLSFLLIAIFLAYFIQGFFLFDLLAVYLGLFPFLAFLIYEEKKAKNKDQKDTQTTLRQSSGRARYLLLIPVALLSLFVIYATAFVPWTANTSALRFYFYTELDLYEKSLPFLEKAFSVHSPYTFWEVRKRAGWQFVQVLEYKVSEETPPEKIAELKGIYDFITPELEKFVEARPSDPQMYYVLGRTYRFGFTKLGKDNLQRAQAILEQGFQHSDTRVEYHNEYAHILLLRGKFEEAERSVKDYSERVHFSDSFPYVTLGHFYLVSERYEQAFEQYEKARGVGYIFVDVVPEYSRYLFVAEETAHYKEVIDMARAYIERWGPDADTYFNIAVGYFNLGDKEAAKEFFLEAVKLKPTYAEYNSFFLE